MYKFKSHTCVYCFVHHTTNASSFSKTMILRFSKASACESMHQSTKSFLQMYYSLEYTDLVHGRTNWCTLVSVATTCCKTCKAKMIEENVLVSL